jgi:hypothetical protein
MLMLMGLGLWIASCAKTGTDVTLAMSIHLSLNSELPGADTRAFPFLETLHAATRFRPVIRFRRGAGFGRGFLGT